MFQNWLSALGDFFRFLGIQLRLITLTDVLDIVVLAFLLFLVLRFVTERRAASMLLGIVIVLVLYGVSFLLQFHATSFVLRSVFDVGLVLVAIIFQPEIRAGVEKLGTPTMESVHRISHAHSLEELNHWISILCDAVADMSQSRTGALIVLERNTKLGDLIETGVSLDATLSVKLLKNIFYDKTPLHDGAVIIRKMRIAAAGCVLPNTTRSSDEVLNVGTRHRAGLGTSEISDAVVIIVSEETGMISLAVNGRLRRDYSVRALRSELALLLGDKTGTKSEDSTIGGNGRE